MKRISITLLFAVSGVARGEWTSSGYTQSNGIAVFVESKLEPANPKPAGSFGGGLQSLKRGQPGMKRYIYERNTLEYFGYDLAVEPLEHTGEYKVTFSPLSLTPEEMRLPDPPAWKVLPSPVFPTPQIVHEGDTIAIDLFENPSTGQKLVDYIRVGRDTRSQTVLPDCISENSDTARTSCLSARLDEMNAKLATKMTELQARGDPSARESLKRTEEIWQKYRDETCQSLSNRLKQLQCQLDLTRSHVRDLKIY
ncbi:MAG: DUF1311 domain-containing protein [Acidobacteriaceae bacterium]|nr:DUF1311 domain-containing protein [Acidobacteriaceae bacterium]